MKLIELCSLGSLRSSEMKPAVSIRSSLDVQSLEKGYRRRGSLMHLATRVQKRITTWSIVLNGYGKT